MLAYVGSSKCKPEEQVPSLHVLFCLLQENPEGFTKGSTTQWRPCVPCKSFPKKLVLQQRLQLQHLVTSLMGRRGVFFIFSYFVKVIEKICPLKLNQHETTNNHTTHFLSCKTFPMSTVVDI